MRYSPSTNGFYPESIEYPNLPEDVITITDKLYNELFKGQAEGKVITPDGSKQPYLAEPAPPSQEQLIAEADMQMASLMAAATVAIAPLQDAVDLEMATDEETALLKKWKQYRVLLSRVDTSTAPDIDWPTPPA